MKEQSYGVEIAKEYEANFNQTITLPTIHVVLKRLDEKGLVESEMGQPTAERGGRRKRIYQATAKGFSAAKLLQEQRNKIWNLIPGNIEPQS